ncbi:MAG: hypothetical protein Q9182_004570 [Xanthomendoza sp. 2 TL-2023]
MDMEMSSTNMTPAGSHTTSPAASPASKQHVEIPELTPRSKYKAMMAAIDDESDSDPPAGSTISRSRPLARPAIVQEHSLERESHGSSDDSVCGTIHNMPAPRGKLAARLQQQSAPSGDRSESDIDHSDDAYSLTKKRLASRTVSSAAHEISPNPSQAATDQNGTISLGMNRSGSPRKSPSDSMKSPQPPSPGLFLTPEKNRRSISQANPMPKIGPGQSNTSDSDLPVASPANSRFLALVARKREQRLAKEAKAMDKIRARELGGEDREPQMMQVQNKNGQKKDHMLDGDSGSSDSEKLTQHIRPTRKASKKALEEMNRETQRMSRNMQLAHQARTKKKITKESLFARFNFRTENSPAAVTVAAGRTSAAASSDVTSDADVRTGVESPPTSPLMPGDVMSKDANPKPEPAIMNVTHREEHMTAMEDELPDIQDVLTASTKCLNNEKGPAAQVHVMDQVPVIQDGLVKGKNIAKSLVRFRTPQPFAGRDPRNDSDSDLEIMPSKKNMRKIDAVFDRQPSKTSDGHSLYKLRALAHLRPSDEYSSSSKASMSLSEMQNSLQKRARQQAARERAEKIEDLKHRGIIIQTAEERQKDQAEVEDLLEKARQEAVDLKQKEKEKAKREARANGEEIAEDTSEDDEDYHDNDADESNCDLSGSDEEEENHLNLDGDNSAEECDGDREDEEHGVSLDKGTLIVDEASEESEDPVDEGPDDGLGASEFEDDVPNTLPPRRRHKNVIVDDDDDDDTKEMHEDQNEVIPPTHHPTPPFPNLGLPVFIGAAMGMTQAFAATMADSQTHEDSRPIVADQEEDSLAFLGPPPEPEFPAFDMEDPHQTIVDSQEMNDSSSWPQAKIDLHLSQFQTDTLGDTAAGLSATQLSEIPDPTQEEGFAFSSPVAGRFTTVPPSTIDTVIIPRADIPDLPVAKKKGRLRRRTDIVLEDESDATAEAREEVTDEVIPATAFDILKKGSKKSSESVHTFDKKKSNAKEMVEEQAQESEDEYAGLGGASDDESHGEEDEEVRKMIEQSEVVVDERQLAAFHADKERASDEKAVEKLFKDINNGMLRRKRGADFDLSDSEDDAEARRRQKRKEFAKMRKALLENENVGKIAEDPKKVAFLRAIEDREDDEDLDFLEQPEDTSQPALDADSQGILDSQPQKGPEDSSPSALRKRKRALIESNPNTTNRPPPAARRTTNVQKPQSMADIKASVSFLVEEPDAVSFLPPPSSSPTGSDDENDENDQTHHHTSMTSPQLEDNTTTTTTNNPNPFISRRRPNAVIDRLSLKRESSSLSTTSNNLAFHHPSHNPSSSTTFKIPSLLRRATTSSLISQADGNGISTLAETERGAGGKEKGEFVRRGGMRGSSVNFVAKAVVKGVEERVREGVRRRVVREGSLRGLGGGRFE